MSPVWIRKSGALGTASRFIPGPRDQNSRNRSALRPVYSHGRADAGKGPLLREKGREARFEAAISPHLNAAYNLARWLTRNDQDAEDVVQEACLRAYRAFDGFHGGDARAWLLAIVRNTSYSWLKKQRGHEAPLAWEDELLDVAWDGPDPEQ